MRATAGTYVERTGAAAVGAVVAGAAAGLGAGLTGVATVLGAEHDTTANDRRMIDDSGFMSDLVFQEGDSGKIRTITRNPGAVSTTGPSVIDSRTLGGDGDQLFGFDQADVLPDVFMAQ